MKSQATLLDAYQQLGLGRVLSHIEVFKAWGKILERDEPPPILYSVAALMQCGYENNPQHGALTKQWTLICYAGQSLEEMVRARGLARLGAAAPSFGRDDWLGKNWTNLSSKPVFVLLDFAGGYGGQAWRDQTRVLGSRYERPLERVVVEAAFSMQLCKRGKVLKDLQHWGPTDVGGQYPAVGFNNMGDVFGVGFHKPYDSRFTRIVVPMKPFEASYGKYEWVNLEP